MFVIDILENFRMSLAVCRNGVLSVSNRRVAGVRGLYLVEQFPMNLC